MAARAALRAVPPADIPVDLGILPSLIGYRLRRAHVAVYADFLDRLAPDKMRPALFSTLEVIGANEGIAPSAVAEAIGVKRANLVPLLDELEERGWIARRAEPRDRRALSLFLTPAGAAARTRSRARIRAHEETFIRELGPGGRETLLRLLQTIMDTAPTDPER